MLAATPQQPGVTVRLQPARRLARRPLRARPSQGLTVVADPTLDPRDAVVETDTSVIDLRVSSALSRVREVLR